MATVLPSFDNHPLLADAELDCLLEDDWATAELQSADLQPLAAPAPEAAAPQEAAPEPAPVAKAGSAVLIEPPAEVAGFVRTLFTLLRVCDPVVIGWSRDGKVLLVRDPARFAAEVCPKFFRHKNFNSFTRLLNMYQFHKRPHEKELVGNGVAFAHESFMRGREDLLAKIKRRRAPKKAPAEKKKRKAPAASKPADAPAWMRRVVDLESEQKRLKAENERLRQNEAEVRALRDQVAQQRAYIGQLSASLGGGVPNAAALNGLAAALMAAPGWALGAAAPPPPAADAPLDRGARMIRELLEASGLSAADVGALAPVPPPAPEEA